MPQSVFEIKEKLVRVLAENGAVKDMGVAADAITSLEGLTITKEDLEKTRLGLYVNQVRKAAKDNPLARRAKNLIKSWQQMILQGSPQLPQAVRPQTPNSVGSSPSPPDPSIRSNVVNHVQVRTPPVFPAMQMTQGNPGTLGIADGKRKHSKNSKGNRIKGKSPVTVRIDDGKMKGHSSDVKGQLKQSPDSGQHIVSVVSPNTNGLKLTFKMQSVANDNAEDEDVDVIANDGNQRWRQEMLEKNNETSPPNPHKKDGRKKHKKKKSHKNSLKNAPNSPNPTPLIERVNPTQEDMYNNNKNESKMATSQSTPNFTVTKQSPAGKHPSPDKVPVLKNNKVISKPQSTGDLKALPTNSNPNLKRKREQSLVNNTTPSSPHTQEEKPRGSKERRLTLTYDPLTKQLQQVAAPPEKSNESSDSQTPQALQKTKASNSVPSPIRPLQKQYTPEPKPELKIKKETRETPKPLPQKEAPFEPKCEEVSPNEIATSLNPVIRINDTLKLKTSECSGNCVSNFYETRREFRKRKTRRKEGELDLLTLFPISNLISGVDTSDSDESSTSENGFCSTIKLDRKAESSNYDVSHSSNCERPGVTGCRGNNGVWYDWLETFCVRNKPSDKSELLPEENEILPLHVLPYVELD